MSRLGRWIDFENDYKTLYPWFMETIWYREGRGGEGRRGKGRGGEGRGGEGRRGEGRRGEGRGEVIGSSTLLLRSCMCFRALLHVFSHLQ